MTNNKQQTAVKWFWNQLPEIIPFTVNTETALKLQQAYEEAKEMELIQISEAHIAGQETEGLLLDDHPNYWACEYYSHKFENQS